MPTILELFKGSTQDKSVKADKETFIEQETSGIRIKSLVDVNNPLIYGNEAIRIVQRSTPLLETMKDNANGSQGDGGLIGGKISQAREFINDKLGIPKGLIPSTVADKIIELRASKTPDDPTSPQLENANSQTPITKDGYGPNGSLVGKFLKQSGGGNPTTIGKQALGQGIGVAKDKLRGALFGEGDTAGTATGRTGKRYAVEYTSNDRTYSDVNTSKTLPSEDGVQTDLKDTKLDLSLVSPLYGVKRKGDDFGRFGNSEYGFKNRKNPGSSQSRYSPEIDEKTKKSNSYTNQNENSLVTTRGISDKTNPGDKIILNPNSYDSIDDKGVVKIGDNEYKDLVPFWIGYYGSSKPTLFRAVVSGLTETVSPSWSSNNFVGNPYKYHIYESIDRGVAFNLSLYCNNYLELAANWERVSQLTKFAYPSVQDNLANPPFIWFKLGDMYHKKAGIIESLTYTFPDNGTWETDVDGYVLPKFIDISLSIKFVENVGNGSLSQLYNYQKSKEAIKSANEEAIKFNSESQTNADGSIGDGANPKKINSSGTTISTPASNKNIKNLNGKSSKPASTPSDDKTKDTTLGQSSTNESLGGDTVNEAIKKNESKVLPTQSMAYLSLLVEGYNRVPDSNQQLQGEKAFSHSSERDVIIGMEKDDKFATISRGGNITRLKKY